MAIYGGIDLGGTKIQAAIVDEDADHEVLGAKRDQTPLKGGPKAIAARMAGVLKEAAEEAGVDVGDARGRRRRLAGQRRRQEGHRLRRHEPVRVAGLVQPAQGAGEGAAARPCALGNDVDLATDAEFEIGAAKQYDTLLGVFWGTGVGGGLILDGKPWNRPRDGRRDRPHGRAHQRRPVRLRAPRLHGGLRRPRRDGGPRAPARGAGDKTVLFKIMEERGRDRLSSGIWERALARDDQLALELLEEAVDALGAGIASAVNLLDPEAVVIGGGLGIRLGDPWVKKIRKAMQPHLFMDDDPPPVLLAELGDLGGAHGGALLRRRAAARGE